MKLIEKFLYETRPISVLLIAVYSLVFALHTPMWIAGAVLVVCSGIIMSRRLRARGIL